MTLTTSRFRYFVAVSPGLEGLLAAELLRLRIAGQTTPGGVECAGSIETLWQLTRFSRLAESVRLRLKPFEAKSFAQLEQGFERLPWHAYLRAGCPFDVAVVCHASQLYHTQAIAERLQRVVDARGCLNAGLGSRVPQDPQRQRIQVRINRNVVQTSIDAAGERLHRRGYRTHVGRAPLRETLAAAAVHLLDTLGAPGSLDRLWDPCCGSATLLSEWLLCRLGMPAQSSRGFAFEAWPIHDVLAYTSWVAQHERVGTAGAAPQAWGSDREPRSIRAAQHNLAQAGLTAHCCLLAEDFRSAAEQIPGHTAVVTNLPYGVRLTHRRAALELFVAVDRLLDERRDLRPVIALNTLEPPQRARCHWQRLAVFANGGLRVNAWALGHAESAATQERRCQTDRSAL